MEAARRALSVVGILAVAINISTTTLRAQALPSASQAASWPRGIFLYREQLTNDAQFRQALKTPGIDGMAVVLDWSALQPSEGAFVTATIDSQIAEAQQNKLPIELVIRAGASTPAWVAPSARLKLAYSPHGGSTGRCEAVDMPPPWDAGYQKAFAAILQKTADYVRTKGAAIAAVKLTGVNSTTEELRLPAESPDVTAHCQGGAVDDIAAWRKAGFTPARMTQALDQIAAIFARTFPATPVTLALIPRGGFPPIDNSGQLVQGPKKAALNDSLLQSLVSGAAAAIPGRFVLQFDYLMYKEPANSTVVKLARSNNIPLAWQTNLWRGAFAQGAGCGGAPGRGTECTDAQYLGLLEEGVHPDGGSGVSARGLYIEVFPFDAIAHPQVIAQVHAELTGQASPPPRAGE
jgi:hypothetical protein